jgi:hypothetical protein
MPGRMYEISGETCRWGDSDRSQNLHSTAAGNGDKQRHPNRCLGKGGRKVDGVSPARMSAPWYGAKDHECR